MFKAFAPGLLICSLVICVSATDNGFPHCNCDEEGLWSLHGILECQRVSDFLIAVAYFSIPVELLYFLSCSNVPFKWVLLQFVAFIVLCGLTHLLNGWTYYGPHSFQLMLALTIAKFLTALVSCATAITLLTLIPLLLKVKVRELFLRQNVLELNQEVGIMKKQKEASWHVRMLTQEIRKSLDKHTILYTTLVELSKTLDLQNCAVWMPNVSNTEMNLTHELKSSSSKVYHMPVPINDPDVLEVKKNKGVRILRPESALGAASSGGFGDSGAVAAIRMPKLSVSNFKGGTPVLVETCYAILVLVLPSADSRIWSDQEKEIVEVVADQVAVALSHAALLEESQLMREKLEERNRALLQAKKNAMMASQAKNSFQKVMSHGMRRPMHSVLGLLSIFQEESLSFDQRIIVDTMVKTGSVLSTLISDVMEISAKENGRLPPEVRLFQLHSMVKEASCFVKCFCVYKGFNFSVDVQNSLPNHVIGDERRAFQVILHMAGYLLNAHKGMGSVHFRVLLDSGSGGKTETTVLGLWRPSVSAEYVGIRFEIEIANRGFESDAMISSIDFPGGKYDSSEVKGVLSFGLCRKLVKVMQGNIWISSNPERQAQTMTLVLRFQIRPPYLRPVSEPGYSMDQSSSSSSSNSVFRGVRVMLAYDDIVNRTVTKKLLEKLGFFVSAVSSGFKCLSSVGPDGSSFRIILLDLHMPEMDGFEVAMRIRKLWSQNRPLIVALTATAEENVWEKCVQNGMDGLIRKPVLLQGLANELRRVLQQANE